MSSLAGAAGNLLSSLISFFFARPFIGLGSSLQVQTAWSSVHFVNKNILFIVA